MLHPPADIRSDERHLLGHDDQRSGETRLRHRGVGQRSRACQIPDGAGGGRPEHSGLGGAPAHHCGKLRFDLGQTHHADRIPDRRFAGVGVDIADEKSEPHADERVP